MIQSHKTRVAGPLVVGLVLGGCASLDPSRNIEQASTLVTDRAQSETGWASPWNEPAGQWDGRSPLSSDTAVRAALQNNRAIRREVETIVAARADLVQAHMLPNPVINIAVGFPTDGLGGDPWSAAIVQQLMWIWRRPVAIDAAEAELRARILAVSGAALDLVAEVRRTHAEVLFAERAVALDAESIDLLARSEALLREKLAVGEATRLDLNRLALDLRAFEVGLTERQADLALAKRRLLERLGRAEAGTEWRTDGVVPAAVTASRELDEVQVIELASRQRLDVAAAAAVVEARVAGVNLEERGRIPDVAAGAAYRQNFENRPGVFPSLAVTPKLFDDNSARIARAESRWRQAAIEADRVRQAALAEARRAWTALRAQREVAGVFEAEIVRLAESNLGLARAALDAGESDLTDLLDAQRRLNDARIDLIERQRATATLVIELERAVGGSLESQPPVEDALASLDSKPEAKP